MHRQKSIPPSFIAVFVALLTLYSSALQAQETYRDCQRADPQERTQCVQKTLPYTDKQLAKVASVICSRIDRFKQTSAQAFEIKPRMCTAVPELCDSGQKYLDMGGVVSYTIAQGLKLSDPHQIEHTESAILTELLTYNCSIESSYALSDVPFHNQKRNYAKRAIFTGQVADMFNQFLFNDFGYEKATGGKDVAWDK